MNVHQLYGYLHKYLKKADAFTNHRDGYALEYLQKCRSETEVAAAMVMLKVRLAADQNVSHCMRCTSIR